MRKTAHTFLKQHRPPEMREMVTAAAGPETAAPLSYQTEQNLKNNGKLEVDEKESNLFGLQMSVTCYQIPIVPFLT